MPNFDQPKPLPGETPEQMATRLAQGLELTPLEGEKKLDQVPNPEEEAVRAEQTRQDEEARTAELARADALAAQIKGGKTPDNQDGSTYIENVKASALESEAMAVFAQIGSKTKETIDLLSEMLRDVGKVNVRGGTGDLENVLYGFKGDFEEVLAIVSSVDVAERMYMNEEDELLLRGRLSKVQQQAEMVSGNYAGDKNIAKVADTVKERVAELQNLTQKIGADVQSARNLT